MLSIKIDRIKIKTIVYLDYYYDERLYPIAIRIKIDNHKLQCYIFDLHPDIIAKIIDNYKSYAKRPYWVDLLDEDANTSKLALIKHHEKYDIDWIPNENTVMYLLEGVEVEYHSIGNSIDKFEKHFGCRVTHTRYVDSETAYKVTYLDTFKRKDVEDRLEIVNHNNMIQAIASIENNITKNLLKYPHIVDIDQWKDLSKYFK